MSDPLPIGNIIGVRKRNKLLILSESRRRKMLFISLIMLLFGPTTYIFSLGSSLGYVQADTKNVANVGLKSPLFDKEINIFDTKEQNFQDLLKTSNNTLNKPSTEKIYALVGESPIKEMVPFISQKDRKVAAFLVGIAKKESSFGSASPSKDGITCYNYWGFKGQGQRGQGMGYACFASAEEAVDTVGGRIEDLVEKNRSTPSKMVDTWKCGKSCSGDPGAPGWVSTVAMYYDQIVDQNS